MNFLSPHPKERNLYLAQQVDQSSINTISKAIIEINDDDEILSQVYSLQGFEYTPKPIKLYIDSYGGLVYQCLGLLGIMEHSKTPVQTIVTGCAMSCGFLIAIAGHEKLCYKKATFMYHQISTGFYGKAKDMEDEMLEARRLQKILEDHTLENTGLTKEMLKDNFHKKVDWFFSAKEAYKYGIVNTIL